MTRKILSDRLWQSGVKTYWSLVTTATLVDIGQILPPADVIHNDTDFPATKLAAKDLSEPGIFALAPPQKYTSAFVYSIKFNK